jgi:hypothetical protein
LLSFLACAAPMATDMPKERSDLDARQTFMCCRMALQTRIDQSKSVILETGKYGT